MTIQRNDLISFLHEHHSHIKCVTPESAEYPGLREAYIIDSPAVPFAIVRLQSAQDVATLVSYAVSKGIHITVRSGGHDLFGRCFAQDALAIDVRDINFVDIHEDRGTATIGGGILAVNLAEALSKEGLATAFGSFATVGYTGWATHGGYGLLAANYGLGVDQIVGATILNASGNLVSADGEMLECIRGGGGCIGVIVDLTIKTYPLREVLGGTIVFKTEDLASTLRNFTAGYRDLAQKGQGLPKELGVQLSVVNAPFGKALAIGFLWSSNDIDQGHDWLKEISSLGGEIAVNLVKQTTVPEWMEISTELPPKSAYGGNCTVSVTEMTDEVVDTMTHELMKMPDDPGTLFTAHQLRGPSTETPQRVGSVFASRTPHYVFEFIGTTVAPEHAAGSWTWVTGFRDALRRNNPDSLLRETYISLTPPDEVGASSDSLYGSRWQRLVDLKRRFDPDNVFRNALPKFA